MRKRTAPQIGTPRGLLGRPMQDAIGSAVRSAALALTSGGGEEIDPGCRGGHVRLARRGAADEIIPPSPRYLAKVRPWRLPKAGRTAWSRNCFSHQNASCGSLPLRSP